MSDVLSFRPEPEELEAIDRTRREIGAKDRTTAIRFLIRKGAAAVGPLNKDPVWKARASPQFRGGKPMSSRDIDEALYGGGH